VFSSDREGAHWVEVLDCVCEPAHLSGDELRCSEVPAADTPVTKQLQLEIADPNRGVDELWKTIGTGPRRCAIKVSDSERIEKLIAQVDGALRKGPPSLQSLLGGFLIDGWLQDVGRIFNPQMAADRALETPPDSAIPGCRPRERNSHSPATRA